MAKAKIVGLSKSVKKPKWKVTKNKQGDIIESKIDYTPVDVKTLKRMTANFSRLFYRYKIIDEENNVVIPWFNDLKSEDKWLKDLDKALHDVKANTLLDLFKIDLSKGFNKSLSSQEKLITQLTILQAIRNTVCIIEDLAKLREARPDLFTSLLAYGKTKYDNDTMGKLGRLVKYPVKLPKGKIMYLTYQDILARAKNFNYIIIGDKDKIKELFYLTPKKSEIVSRLNKFIYELLQIQSSVIKKKKGELLIGFQDIVRKLTENTARFIQNSERLMDHPLSKGMVANLGRLIYLLQGDLVLALDKIMFFVTDGAIKEGTYNSMFQNYDIIMKKLGEFHKSSTEKLKKRKEKLIKLVENTEENRDKLKNVPHIVKEQIKETKSEPAAGQ